MNTAEFLQTLYSGVPDGALEVTFIPPDEIKLYPRTVVMWQPLPLVIRDPNMTAVMSLNERGYGAYFGVTVRAARKHPEERTAADGHKYIMQYPRGTQKDAKWLTALWVDVDGGANDDNLARVRSVEPSIIVASGGGYHGYLLLDEPLLITDANREDVKRALKGLAKLMNADSHSAELARVLRLPGTVNTKPKREGAKCAVIDASMARYTFNDLLIEFGRLVAPPRPVLRIDRDMPAVSDDYPEWVKQYLANGALVGSRNARLYAVACFMRDSGISESTCEQTAGARAAADGLDAEEINRTIASAYSQSVTVAYTPTRISVSLRDKAARVRNGGTW